MTAKWRLFRQAFAAMYYASRTDYPCEGCEQGRVRSIVNAWSWARGIAKP